MRDWGRVRERVLEVRDWGRARVRVLTLTLTLTLTWKLGASRGTMP